MHAALKPQTFQWHCASAGQEIPCPACEGTKTNWLYATPMADVWGCACGQDFAIFVEDVEPAPAYRVGTAVFTDIGMARQFAGNSGQIEEVDLYSDIM